MSERAWATIDFLRPTEAIIEVTTTTGRWLGAERITVKSGQRSDLYEAGYTHAAQRAGAHGLILDRFSAVP